MLFNFNSIELDLVLDKKGKFCCFSSNFPKRKVCYYVTKKESLKKESL